MGEQRDVASNTPEALQHPVHTGGNVLRGLAVGDAVAPQQPPGPITPNVDGPKTLVVPVVPLAEVLGHDDGSTEAGESTGLQRPGHGAGEHQREGVRLEPRAKEARLVATAFGQWDVGAAGVLPGQRPLGLAVAHEHDSPGGFVRRARRAPTGHSSSTPLMAANGAVAGQHRARG